MFNEALAQKATAILDVCKTHGCQLATVESCTGGLLGAMLTELPGSSRMFTHGYITYANTAKTEMVGVDAALIATYGAVSEQVARAMAEGGRDRSGAHIALAITGIAGPEGGTASKPVGTVHFACAIKGAPTIHAQQQFAGNRSEIRLAAVDHALDMILNALSRAGAA